MVVVGNRRRKNDSTFYFDLAPVYKVFLALNILVFKAGEIFYSRTIFKLKKVHFYRKQKNKILLILIKNQIKIRGFLDRI